MKKCLSLTDSKRYCFVHKYLVIHVENGCFWGPTENLRVADDFEIATVVYVVVTNTRVQNGGGNNNEKRLYETIVNLRKRNTVYNNY